MCKFSGSIKGQVPIPLSLKSFMIDWFWYPSQLFSELQKQISVGAVSEIQVNINHCYFLIFIQVEFKNFSHDSALATPLYGVNRAGAMAVPLLNFKFCSQNEGRIELKDHELYFWLYFWTPKKKTYSTSERTTRI